MQFYNSNIKVAGYLTLLPPKKLLLKKFHKAIEIACGQMENKILDKDKLGI